MKYTVFQVEENRADGIATAKKEGGKHVATSIAIVEAIIVHQEVANKRHNSAMLEKDIVIANLEGKLEILKENR